MEIKSKWRVDSSTRSTLSSSTIVLPWHRRRYFKLCNGKLWLLFDKCCVFLLLLCDDVFVVVARADPFRSVPFDLRPFEAILSCLYAHRPSQPPPVAHPSRIRPKKKRKIDARKWECCLVDGNNVLIPK